MLDCDLNPKLLDFGLSTFRHGGESYDWEATNRKSVVIHFSRWFSPTQIEEGPVTETDDIHAFGCIVLLVSSVPTSFARYVSLKLILSRD